ARRRALALGGLAVVLPVLFLTSIAVGPVTVPLDDTLRVLTGHRPSDPRWTVVIETIRLPRVVTAALVGAALGVAGMQMQTLFRNALADPFSLGVSSGASLGVALVVITGGAAGSVSAGFTADLAGMGRVGVVVAAALGAAAVLAVILVLSRWVRQAVTLLVIGVMLGSAVSAVVSVMIVYTDPQRAQQFVLWGLGSFSGTTWADLRVLAPLVGGGLLLALASAKHLNALLLGENYARTMGLNVRRTRTLTLLGAAVLAGSTTAFCGPIAFVGLAVPHLARALIGTSDHRVLGPACVLTGAGLALICTLLSQPPGTDAALPVNAITSLFGAPVVIAVLLRSRRVLQGAG
ncbi:FecCD family ABC transporter permease, partial [Yinghuangia sp. YIM S10712]|uniref:FecCD family ABC transporter permease n=1 Tax=Yinghuangia sp. YIM S10712 TaxID=3436930 RepID=UPI003F5379A5